MLAGSLAASQTPAQVVLPQWFSPNTIRLAMQGRKLSVEAGLRVNQGQPTRRNLPRALQAMVLQQTVPEPPKDDSAPVLPKAGTAGKSSSSRAIRWWRRNLVDRVDVTGQRVLGWHFHEVTGDEEAFATLNYSGLGTRRFTDTGQMTMTGNKVLGLLNFQVSYSGNEFYDPESQRMSLDFARDGYRVSAGNIRASLPNSNPFATFNRFLTGALVGYRSGRLDIAAIRSETEAAARTVNFNGNNSVGPYFLQSGRVVSDSVQVQVDGQQQTLLKDYVLNSEIGSITFLDRVIPPTSTIVVSYESLGFGGPTGVLEGVGATYNLGRFGRIGITRLEQRSGDDGRGNAIIQRFFGFGSAGAQYWLDFEPIPGTVQVRVDGIVQVPGPADAPGGDYFFDPLTPFVLYFKRPVPMTSLIDVVYSPKSPANLDGDRRVFGWDYRLPLGRDKGFLQYSQAHGELLSRSNPLNGLARGITGAYEVAGIRMRGSLKDIPREYVTVQSRGFNRNEQLAEFAVDWTRGHFAQAINYANRSIETLRFAGNSVTSVQSRVNSLGASVSYRPAGTPEWTLSHNRSFSRRTEETRLDTTSLSGARSAGRLSLNYGFDWQNGKGPISDGISSQIGNLTMQTARFGATYRPREGLSLIGRASASWIRALDNSGRGTDLSFTATYQGQGRLNGLLSYVESDSGEVATLGSFSNGFGEGFGGNGFSGGPLGSGAFGVGGTALRQWIALAEYQASERLRFFGRARSSRSAGAFSSNSVMNSFGASVDYDLDPRTNVSLSVDRSATSFLSAASIASRSLVYDLSLRSSPRGPWSYRIGVNGLTTEGGGIFDQDSLGVFTGLTYRLTDRQSLSATGRWSRSTGYYGQDERYLGVFYSYRIFGDLALVASYKWRNVANIGEVLSGAYQSSGLDLELRFDFR